jgi:MFS transporter, YNFM family, putative membrane transport protein
VAVMALLSAVAYRLLLPRPRNFVAAAVRPRMVARTVRGHLREPVLRRLYVIGLLLMAAFSAVCTVIGFRLATEPFGLSAGLIGSVFLVYLVGTGSAAATAPLVARWGRRGALYLAIGTVTAGLLLSLASLLAAVLAGLVLITGGFFLGHAVASSAVGRAATAHRSSSGGSIVRIRSVRLTCSSPKRTTGSSVFAPSCDGASAHTNARYGLFAPSTPLRILIIEAVASSPH